MTKYCIKKENKLYEKSNRYRGGPGWTYGGVLDTKPDGFLPGACIRGKKSNWWISKNGRLPRLSNGLGRTSFSYGE